MALAYSVVAVRLARGVRVHDDTERASRSSQRAIEARCTGARGLCMPYGCVLVRAHTVMTAC